MHQRSPGTKAAPPGPALLAQMDRAAPVSGAGARFESSAAHVNESLKALRDPRLDLAAVLCDLILDIRKVLVHPDLQNAVKLAAIAELVDELAPPPPACPAG